MSFRLSCPYCNTAFALDRVPADRRAVCPRCGDAFPLRPEAAGEEEGLPSSPGGSPAGHDFVPPPGPAPRRTFSAGRFVAVGVGMAVVGFVAAVLLSDSRGKPPVDGGPGVEASPAAVTPPGELAGLAYLPADANLVAAVQPGPALAFAARTGRDPRDLLAKAGVPNAVFALLDAAGVSLQQVDHVVAGAAVGDGAAEFRFALALVLRRPLDDEERFLKALKAGKLPRGGRTLYSVALGPLPAVMAKAGPRAWLFGAGEKDVAAASGPTSASLRETLATRLGTGPAAWAAADDAAWADKPAVKLAVGELLGRKDLLATLAKGRAAAASLQFDDPPRLRLFVRTADTAAGDALRAYFEKQAAAAGEGARHGGAGEWAFFDRPVDPAAPVTITLPKGD